MTDQRLDAWWRVLAGARWFAGKGLSGRLTELTPLPWLTRPGQFPAVRAEIATVSYDSQPAQHYLLLAGYTHRPQSRVVTWAADPEQGALAVVEATADPECLRTLLAALASVAPDAVNSAVAADPNGDGASGPTARAGHPAMEWLQPERVHPSAPAKVLAGEQSNTTISIGNDTLLKLFRRLEPGRNLDVEVLAALNGSGITPELFGTLVGELPGAGRADLGMFVARVPGVQDGWEWACAACAAGQDITAEAADLGRALRRVHVALAARFGTSTASGEELAAAILGRVDAAADSIPELGDVREAVARALIPLAKAQLATQRIHGDFHLGQTLRSPQGWTIIDFEGEPLRSLTERREPDSVWRDVAGMLRSFDYVWATQRDSNQADLSQARAWSRSAAQAFLDGYCGSGLPDAAALVGYQLDKAAYEVVYEARNRPDWVQIPMTALREAAGLSAPAPTSNQEETR